ncbi:hypothetical protein MPSEU_000175800 [Mayamaea pseudoterrestris]|nr:hypothetical protein MPSEU_000175800 [Mayamaea pseudoterrestris]
MGNQTSSQAKASGNLYAKKLSSSVCEDGKHTITMKQHESTFDVLADALTLQATDDAPSVSTTESYDDEDWDDEEEEDEEWEERLQILADARALKKAAVWFLHPEEPVESAPIAMTHCFFDHASDPVPEVDAEEQNAIFNDLAALKKLAKDYLHPEAFIETDPAVFGRNYFDRPSAVPKMDENDAEERAQILSEAKALKQLAVDYMHPELSVVTSDPTAFGRNYFTRPSAIEQDVSEDEAERVCIMQDLKALKQLAKEYMHPELPVMTTDPTACGRNYFSHASASDQADVELEAERVRMERDLKALKQLAKDYLHPELPVMTLDPFACGRNYFSRASAPEFDAENEEERTRIMQDMKSLKQLAKDYMHPELPVKTLDPFACGRNYFSRASAIEQDDAALEEERARVLDDLKMLKQLAVDYVHPELPVNTTDPMARGRNFFSRASALEYDAENEEERIRIMQDLKALKTKAVEYLHPELPVVTLDPFARGRNYFGRASAPEQDDPSLEKERACVFAELKALKQLAKDYMHPELPVVTTDATACGRNFFSRASAPEYDAEWEEERVQVMEDLKALKQTAVEFLHPELPVVTSDPTACGRNFFMRASAPVQEDPSLEEERLLIMEELKALKAYAADFMHPEAPVVVSDPTATGRNYFGRADAPGHREMIHTFPPHKDDYDQTDNLDHTDYNHEHLDHFGMDEDMDFTAMRGELRLPSPPIQQQSKLNMSDEEASNLSRSPSSVMLFSDEPIYD